ncbi:MAG: Ribonuclease VapC [Caulobacteraceae bacterium]|nr:Ribonuclease VapC [Caulobacteraceae bacterium]
MPAALQLAAKLGHPVYDCVYLASAIRQNLTVVTADQRFAKVVEASDLASRVRLLGA